MVVSMGYYGLSLNTGNLSGDFYLNFFLSGLAEFPAYTICVIFLDKTGRKPLHVLCMVLGGVACISTIFTTIYLDEGKCIELVYYLTTHIANKAYKQNTKHPIKLLSSE